MGLAITRGLLAIQGGRITAANHPDGGAVFTLEVPAATRAASELTLDVA
jgi:K+-sensing histidine kinase KdpD